MSFLFFFFNDTATTEIYTLSLHDALPIFTSTKWSRRPQRMACIRSRLYLTTGHCPVVKYSRDLMRSEEHTSELQSHSDLVCRLLLEKKKTLMTDEALRSLPCSLGSTLHDR